MHSFCTFLVKNLEEKLSEELTFCWNYASHILHSHFLFFLSTNLFWFFNELYFFISLCFFYFILIFLYYFQIRSLLPFPGIKRQFHLVISYFVYFMLLLLNHTNIFVIIFICYFISIGKFSHSTMAFIHKVYLMCFLDIHLSLVLFYLDDSSDLLLTIG